MLRLAWRAVVHHRAATALAVLGVTVATATVVAALVLGDSLRGTLRACLLARLGPVAEAVAPLRGLRAGLADAAVEPGRSAALRALAAVASDPATGAAVPATVLAGGADARALFPDLPQLAARQAALSPALAADLGVQAGDELLLTLARHDAQPAGSVFAERRSSRTVAATRVVITAVLPLTGAAAFSLDPGVEAPRSLWVQRAWLDGVLGDGRVEALVASGPGLAERLARHASLDDLGLRLRPDPARGLVTVQGDGLVLPAPRAATVVAAIEACGGRARATAIHLADRLRGPGGEASYALVAALGGAVPDADGIVLTAWLAEDLGARPGDHLEADFPVPGEGGALRFQRTTLTVRGVIPDAEADPALVPEVPGLTDAARIESWDLPYPVESARVSARDDQWWQERRTAPKAFIHPKLAQRLWEAGPLGGAGGWISGFLAEPPPGETLAVFVTRLEERLRADRTALIPTPVRAQALARAQGNADVGGLFLGLGFFVVAAGLALAVWITRLQVERRAAEAGLLAACGWTPGRIARLLLVEGALVALLGALLGALGGIAGAQGLAALLAAGWSGAAVGVPLTLHVQPGSLALGAGAGLLAGLGAAWWGLRALRRRPILDLLAGWRAAGTRAAPAPPRLWPPLLGLLVAGACLGMLPPAAAGPLAGAAILVAGCTATRLVLHRLRQRRCAPITAEALRDPGRLHLVVGLTAAAAFILVLTATQRAAPPDPAQRNGPCGGFALRVTTALPLREDVAEPTGRARLGVTPDEERVLAQATFVPLLLSPGEDISCRNPARPTQPRLVGVDPALLAERFGGDVAALTADAGDAVPVLGDADSVRWTLGLRLGDELPGAPPLRLVGTFPASVFAGELVADRRAFRRRHPEVAAPRSLLIEMPPDQTDAVAAILRRRLAGHGVVVQSTAELVAAQYAVRNAYLALFLALGGCGLALGVAGLAAVLARALIDRRGELALLAVLGFRRRAVLAQALAPHLVLVVAGLLVGLLAAAVAALAVPPPPGALRAALVPLATVALAGLGSAALVGALMLRRDPLPELRHE